MSPRLNAASAFAATQTGLRVLVRLTPRAGRDAFDGLAALDDGAEVLKAKVRAAPQDGAANRALIRLTAQTLGVAASRIRLESGATSRLKTIVIEGGGPAAAELLSKTG
jgi:uncharacterized protein YggU (UPF0235/DUF167 family)